MREYKHVGIYGGTFDPIHLGHINMALEILEARKLDEIWFCPARMNPHKEGKHLTEGHHRMKMLELALTDLPHFGLVDTELKREGPSYTIDTLRELIEVEKHRSYGRKFSLLIGEDAVPGFFHWREAIEIVKLVSIFVARRSCFEKPLELEGDPLICSALKKGMTPTREMEISATEIRERVGLGLYIRHLVPSKVVDYIYANHLYSKDLL